MKFCDERIQKHLLNGGKITHSDLHYPIFLRGGTICFKNGSGEILSYSIREDDLTNDDWEIVEPEYDWDKIIEDKILCQFWDELEETNTPCVGYLTKKTVDGFYKSEWYCSWKHCKPFNPKDFNIAKDLKEYEE